MSDSAFASAWASFPFSIFPHACTWYAIHVLCTAMPVVRWWLWFPSPHNRESLPQVSGPALQGCVDGENDPIRAEWAPKTFPPRVNSANLSARLGRRVAPILVGLTLFSPSAAAWKPRRCTTAQHMLRAVRRSLQPLSRRNCDEIDVMPGWALCCGGREW